MKNRHEILLPIGAKVKIAQALGCSPKMVWEACTYQKNTPLAERIRFTAVKHFGGVEAGSKEQGTGSNA